MNKGKVNYILNLIIILLSYIITIFFNIKMFNLKDPVAFFYGIGCIILCLLVMYVLYLIKNKYELSLYIGMVLGIIILVFLFFDTLVTSSLIIKNFRIVNFVIFIDGILISINSFKELRRIHEKVIEEESDHKVGHNTSRKREKNINKKYREGNKNMDGIVVNGYIKEVVFDDTVGVFCLEIEYFYEGEVYVFYYGNFDIDITPILDQKDIRKINVFLPGNNPEYAQIDEELLYYRINN